MVTRTMIPSIYLLLFVLLSNTEGLQNERSEYTDDLQFMESLVSQEAEIDPWSDLSVIESVVSQRSAEVWGSMYSPQLIRLKEINEAERQRSEGSRYCDKDLGCFGAGDRDFWNPLYRPINVLPRTREALNTKYLLYTLKNPREPYSLRPTSNGTSLEDYGPFDPTKDTKFIVPGWIDRPTLVHWMKDLARGLLLRDDVNVVVVDWSGGNGPPYTLAVANARVVGAELALLISNMQVSGSDLSKVHVIGHSLGVHVAGYAGERLQGLGRITGLDPAGPYFQGMPASVRLDQSDALMVDVWHTDDGPLLNLGFGMNDAIGHVDFYPNGGTRQPGCTRQRFTTVVTEGLVMGLRRFLGCNHERAIQLYLDATTSPPDQCCPVAYPCSDWDTFNAGHCSSCDGGRCANMSLNIGNNFQTHSNQTKLYLRTAEKAPYCLHHYRVSVQLSQTGQDRQGRMYLKLSNKKMTIQANLGDSAESLHPGATYQYLVTSAEKWPLTSDVNLEWRSSELSLKNLFIKPKILVQSLTVKPMTGSQGSRSGRQDANEIWKFSVPGNAPLVSGKSQMLVLMDS